MNETHHFPSAKTLAHITINLNLLHEACHHYAILYRLWQEKWRYNETSTYHSPQALTVPMNKSGEAEFDVTPQITGRATNASGQRPADLLWAAVDMLNTPNRILSRGCSFEVKFGKMKLPSTFRFSLTLAKWKLLSHRHRLFFDPISLPPILGYLFQIRYVE
jgi:hypothetical protein